MFTKNELEMLRHVESEISNTRNFILDLKEKHHSELLNHEMHLVTMEREFKRLTCPPVNVKVIHGFEEDGATQPGLVSPYKGRNLADEFYTMHPETPGVWPLSDFTSKT